MTPPHFLIRSPHAADNIGPPPQRVAIYERRRVSFLYHGIGAVRYIPRLAELLERVGVPLALDLPVGQDQLFPKGLPVGTVVSVQPGDFFQVIEVQPAAFLSRLEHVLVLTGPRDALGTSARSQVGTSPDGSR